MRGFAVAVVSSVIAHTGVVAWVASLEPDDRLVDPGALHVTAGRSPEAMIDRDHPLEVTFFEYPSNAATSASVSSSSSAASPLPAAPAASAAAAASASRGGNAPGKRGATQVTAGSTAPGVELGGSGTPDGTTRSPLMTMRKPGSDLRGPSGRFFDEFMKNTKPIPPPPDIPGERIGDQIKDLRAQLKRAERYSPGELAAKRAELVALNAQREAEELKPAGGGTYATEKETFRAKVAADGSVKLEDKPENMDTQDRMMLERGIDPYGRNKLRYLDRTRDQRVAIGKRWREEQLRKSVIYMQQHVARLFAMTDDVAKHKQGLFELWDECSETGRPEEIAGGEAARTFVMSIVRTKVRYTADELLTLNAQRQSQQVFAP